MVLGDILKAFKKGKEVANPESWKTGSLVSNLVFIVGAIVWGLKFFGVIDLEIDKVWIQNFVDVTIAGVAALLAAFNMISTVISSKKIGIGSAEVKQKISGSDYQ